MHATDDATGLRASACSTSTGEPVRRPRGPPREPRGRLPRPGAAARGRPVRRGRPRLPGGGLMTATSSGPCRAARRPARAAPRVDRVHAEPAQLAGPVASTSSRHSWPSATCYLRRDTRRSTTPASCCRRWPCPASSAALIAFGLVIGPAYTPGDGEGGRHAPAAPRRCPTASRGYFSGQLLFQLAQPRPADGRRPRPELPALRRPHGRTASGWFTVAVGDRRSACSPRSPSA